MEASKEDRYEVIITGQAETSYYEILDYLFENYAFDRAEKVANEIREKAKSLAKQPRRGSFEPRLSNRSLEYRFILYRRTQRADIKIIYFIDQQ